MPDRDQRRTDDSHLQTRPPHQQRGAVADHDPRQHQTGNTPRDTTTGHRDRRDPQEVAEGRDEDVFPSRAGSSYPAVSAANPEPLLSVDQVALWLGKPKATLYAWRSRGLGPRGIRVGNALRYRRTEVERWLDEHTDQSPNS